MLQWAARKQGRGVPGSRDAHRLVAAQRLVAESADATKFQRARIERLRRVADRSRRAGQDTARDRDRAVKSSREQHLAVVEQGRGLQRARLVEESRKEQELLRCGIVNLGAAILEKNARTAAAAGDQNLARERSFGQQRRAVRRALMVHR